MMVTIIFDFDGTLVDSFPLLIECVNSFSSKYGYEPIDESIKNKHMKQAMKEDLCLSWWQVPFYMRNVTNLFKKSVVSVNFFPKVIPILMKLANQHELFIVTSNKKDKVLEVLKKNSVSCFKEVYASSLFGKDKVLRKIIKKHNILNAFYVGDEVRDIQACKKVNLPIIAVSWGFNNKSVLKKARPDFLIDSFEELVHITGTS